MLCISCSAQNSVICFICPWSSCIFDSDLLQNIEWSKYVLTSTILSEIGQEHIAGQVLTSGANCNLAFLTASATTALTKHTLGFIAIVIKSLLTIHFTFHTSASCFTRGTGQNLKANKDQIGCKLYNSLMSFN